MTPETTAENPDRNNTQSGLPSLSALFSQGWHYLQNNLALVGILSVPFVVIDILTYLDTISAGSLAGTSSSVLLWASLAALISYVLLLATALYLVTHQAQTPQFADGFAWARRHFWSVLWLSILTGFVVLGGFALLIVPGIIVATYIALSQIVLAAEGSKGLAALMRSRDLVYGNWLAVFWRLVVAQLVYFVTIVLLGIVVGVVSAFLVDELLSEFIFNLLFSVLGSAGTLIFLSITYQMYIALKATKESVLPVEVPPATTKYIALGCFGLVSLILTVIMFGVFAVMSVELQTAQDTQMTDTVLQTELKLVQFQAEQYYFNQGAPSYLGVCNEVRSLVSEDRVVQCSESLDAYALSAQIADTTYCVDSTGYDKIIYTDLGERTQCLDF